MRRRKLQQEKLRRQRQKQRMNRMRQQKEDKSNKKNVKNEEVKKFFRRKRQHLIRQEAEKKRKAIPDYEKEELYYQKQGENEKDDAYVTKVVFNDNEEVDYFV
uniref:Nucleolar protein 12 n=1 Tax=Strongyloides venezuelensis TaxID=75913 RepID=A0A0K0FIW3_STRVS